MKTIAAVSIALLGSAGCTAHDVGLGEPAPGAGVRSSRTPTLIACHRVAPPAMPAHATRPFEGRRSHQPLALPRKGSVGLAQLEAVVRTRMPDRDAIFHREIAKAIHDEARDAQLDPLLILALIHVESSFDPGAVSYAGATGLMQLKQRTLRREIERAGWSPADGEDPVANVRAGIRYLRRLVRAFGNNDVALMAYNAGPNRILAYHRAGEIPDRFHAYPRRIRSERERLRSALVPPRRADHVRPTVRPSA